MPRPNFYMSEKDRKVLLSVISNYFGMWESADPDVIDSLSDEFDEISKVQKKIINMYKSKSYSNAVIKDALEMATKYVK